MPEIVNDYINLHSLENCRLIINEKNKGGGRTLLTELKKAQAT
ncbi:hypothetical protein [uncultured Ligilactobacillus sp.]